MAKLNILLIILINSFAGSVFAQTGSLDSSFGINGIIKTQVGKSSSSALAMLIQADGKVILVGHASDKNGLDFALARFEENGSLDKSFGEDGKVMTDFAKDNDYATSAILQTDEKIVVAGYTLYDTFCDFALVRYFVDGKLDTSFGDKGKVRTKFGNNYNQAYAISLHNDGKIVLAGKTGTGYTDEDDFIVCRYHKNGSEDSSFGTNGRIITSLSPYNDRAYAIIIRADDRIIVGGASVKDTSFVFTLLGFTSLGTVDSSFGINGTVTTNFGRWGGEVRSLLLLSDGKIIAGGYSRQTFPYRSEHTLVRYLKDGQIDSTFGINGVASKRVLNDAGYNGIYAMTLQKNGKIVAVGNTADQIAMLVFNENGSLNYGFGDSGVVVTEVTKIGRGEAFAVGIQKDDKILVAGTDNSNFLLIRYLSEFNLGVIDFSLIDDSPLVYPNPIKDKTVIEYTLSKKEEISIQLMDLQGKIVKTFLDKEDQYPGPQKELLDFSNDIPSGTYLVVLSSPNGKIFVKVVK
jgi:uncharacterized delta-60 repeat protein